MATLPPPDNHSSPQTTLFNMRTIVTNNTFHLLLKAVIETIQATVTAKDVTWNLLINNGITSTKFANVANISHILQCCKTILTIMAELSHCFPVLKSTWMYEQLNNNKVAVSKIMTTT